MSFVLFDVLVGCPVWDVLFGDVLFDVILDVPL
jgi:hypothetical protein